MHSIGKELDKLGRTINDMTPVSELPFNVRPKSRKEKNKLASRACRLKKKAQHEANKIKLFGLETEHSECCNDTWLYSTIYWINTLIIRYFDIAERLLSGIADIKKALAYKFARQTENTEEVNQQIDQMAVAATSMSAINLAKLLKNYNNKYYFL